MVPCHICGKDSTGGWIAGLPPAPDSQKVGLCPEHDNISNREIALQAWQARLNTEIEMQLDNRKWESGGLPFKLVIHFLSGGNVIVPCQSFGIVDGNTLETIDAQGEHKFFPLQHVRSYHVIKGQEG